MLLATGCASLDGVFGGGDDGKSASGDDALGNGGSDKLEAGPEGAPPKFGAPAPPTPIPFGVPTFSASDGASVYLVVDRGNDRGAILRSEGGAPPTVLVDDVYRPTGLAVDGGRVFFAAGIPTGGHTVVRSIDKHSGGVQKDAFDTGWGSSAFTALALQGVSLAWASKADEKGAVYRGLSDGTGVVTLATNQGPVGAVAVAGPWVYWARNNALLRKQTSASPEAEPQLVAMRGLFTSIASDGLDVYATSDDGTLVATTATSDVPVVRVLADGLLQPRALAVDPWFVYTVSTGSGSVVGVHRRSARRVEIGRGGDPWELAVTGSSVWIIDRNWRVMTAVPKLGR
jgi:hypothetical protein